MKKVLITVGGTGGHIYPALALADRLRKDPDISLLFVGGNLAGNRYFDRERYPYHSIDCGALFIKNPIRLLKNIGAMLKGFFQARRIVKEYKPDLIIGFGSYHSVPVLLAAKFTSYPILLYAADSIPGKAIRLFAKSAKAVGIHFSEAAKHLKGKVVEVRIPLREGYKKSNLTKAEARKHYNLDPEKTTILVFGGSQGAKGINFLFSQAILKHAKESFTNIQILHFTGDAAKAEELQRNYQEKAISACVKTFESRMDMAWQAADLMISRSGAVTLAEQTEFEVAGILIPYPFAADCHQEKNAEHMVKEVGGGVMLLEQALNPALLAEEIDLLLQNNKRRLHAMQQAIHHHKQHSRSIDFYTFARSYLTP